MTSVDATKASGFHPPVRAGQVQMLGCPRAQVVTQLAAVDLAHRAVQAGHRDDQRAGEMLMARRAQHPQRLQPAPQLGALLAVLAGQAVTEGTVRDAQAEPFQRLGVSDAPALQIPQGVR